MQFTTRHALLAITLFVAACSGDKYPYPPQFVTSEEIPPTMIPVPPTKGSEEYNLALNTVIARQKHLSKHDLEVIKAEDHIKPDMMVGPVIGRTITAEQYPALFNHLSHTASDAWRIGDTAQDYYKSPRPWYADKDRVKLYVEPITRPGYPSGHTTTNTVWAYTLGDLLPCKQAALLARASAIGYHRTQAGAHFPFDVEGGKKLGTIIYSRMQQSPDFKAEHEAARQELAASKDAAAHCPVK